MATRHDHGAGPPRRIARRGWDLDLPEGEAFEDALLAILLGGKKLEVKYQPDAEHSLFIELESRGRPSGLSTTIADWWAIWYAQGRQAILVRTDVLKAIVDDVERDRGRTRGGDDWTSLGVVVRITKLATPWP